jgi:hypothetical protein
MMLATHSQIHPHPIIVGPSLPWTDALQKAARVAATSITVLDREHAAAGALEQSQDRPASRNNAHATVLPAPKVRP